MKGRDWHISPTQDDYEDIRMALVRQGNRVQADQWQSTAQVDPMKQVIEFEFCTVVYNMAPDIFTTQTELTPNLPWAEEHFLERVSGQPFNPPPSHVNWPFAQGANEKFTPEGKFSHTYPERLWGGRRYITPQPPDNSIFPGTKSAPMPVKMQSIADLDDLVILLHNHPTTRQAFIPIWWPIDGKMAEKERVPCTIGYHFLLRDRMLHCHYFMRSCDAMRHLPDDLYMATRLTQWLCEKLSAMMPFHEGIEPGVLAMQITSLHIFEGDVQVIEFQRSQR